VDLVPEIAPRLGIDAGGRLVEQQQLRVRQRAGAEREPPLPFNPETEPAFLDWLNSPAAGVRADVSRYLYSIYQDRPDLVRAFPDLAGDDGARYVEWLRHSGPSQEDIPPPLQAPGTSTSHADASTPSGTSPAEGVNIAGYFSAEVGVGEAARLLTRAIEATGSQCSTLTYDATLSRKNHAFQPRGDGQVLYDVNVICVNADQTPWFAKEMGPQLFDGRHTIGYWFWELEHFPSTMHTGFEYVQEVWAATHFIANSIDAVGRKPVYTIPLPISVPSCAPHVTRKGLRLPDGFMFRFMFDFFSVVERKNPYGLIAAFERAFRPNEGPVLIIKTINGSARLNELERLNRAVKHRDDICVIDEYYSADQKNALTGLCDAYVSLHRSEGFGLTMAEAMALGKPVIATAYSGNLDFMTAENSYLVNYTRGAVPAGCDPYPVGTPWAEPDLDQAAEFMRRVVDAPSEAARKGERAKRDVLTKHDVRTSANIVSARLEEIRHQRRSSVSVPSIRARYHLETMGMLSADDVAHLLTPTPSADPGGRFYELRRGIQKLLFRVLRPYWWQQREVNRALLLSARQTEIARIEQRQAIESLSSAVRRLEANSGGSPNPQSVQPDLRSFQESISTFQDAAAAHLKALTEQLEHVTRKLETLSHRLYAPPHMQNPEQLSLLDSDGKRVLGFKASQRSGKNVYLGFEDVFRGSENFIRERLRTYIPLLSAHELVIEIGSGRGEMLDLLREAHISSIGVDADATMVACGRAKGHVVEHVDGVAYLEGLPDSSLPAIFSAQVVEHLPYEAFIAFLERSYAKLTPGGLLIFETVNPHSIEAFKTFWTDLTHQRPIFPEVALLLTGLVGFEQAHVVFPNGSGEYEHDRTTCGEYAVIATKRSTNLVTTREGRSASAPDEHR